MIAHEQPILVYLRVKERVMSDRLERFELKQVELDEGLSSKMISKTTWREASEDSYLR